MALYLGVDSGSSGARAIVLDSRSGSVVARAERPYPFRPRRATSTAGPPRSESDAEAIWSLCGRTIRDVVARLGRRNAIGGIGVTGQMHGTVLVAGRARPRSPFIDWRDRRCDEAVPGSRESFLDRMYRLAGPDGFSRVGCRPAAGYMAATLFWMAVTRSLPSGPCTACFLPDYVVAKLTGRPPVTDPTNAGGSGLFDVIAGAWDQALVGRLGLPLQILPSVVPSASRAGGVGPAVAAATGLARGTPVFAACGDNQASFAGSVASYDDSILVNVGTGAQVSAHTPAYARVGNLETRRHADGGFLIVGAGVAGGRAYAFLRDTFLAVGRTVFDLRGTRALYAKMNRLAAAVPPGAEGLTCEPLFFGSRLEPHRRGAWSGVTSANFSPGHMARAVLEGMSEQYRRLAVEMSEAGLGPRPRLVVAGTAVRRNPVLREALARAFGVPANLPVHGDEAAVGAALVAATGAGEFESLDKASAIIRCVSGGVLSD